MTREDLLARTFVQLADSLVDDFDIIELLSTLADRCVDLVDASAVGILLADADGHLRLMAASSEQARLLELFQLQNEQGPCLEAYSTGEPVVHNDLAVATERWPRFAPEAIGASFKSVYALPLRLRTSVIGALNLFRSTAGAMPELDVSLAQALADVASIAILQDQAVRRSQIRAGELQHALDSRVVIEQAKGMLAERAGVDMHQAFGQLRSYARNNNRQLTAVAADIVGGVLAIDDLSATMAPARRPPR
ncbi:MAG: GAF and ANTAR domain-containing protein [Acidimicrobiales bacterium]